MSQTGLDFVHSRLLVRLASVFQGCPWLPCTRLDLQIAPKVTRLADLVVYRDQQPTGSVPTTPPSIIIEILSEEHPLSNVLEALHEYQHWGVPHIWVIDPWLRKLQQYSESLLQEVEAFEIPGTDIRITLDQLLAGLPLN